MAFTLLLLSFAHCATDDGAGDQSLADARGEAVGEGDAETLGEIAAAAVPCQGAGDCPPLGCHLASCVAERCAYHPQADGVPCDDGRACSTGDRCAEGLCLPLEVGACAEDCESDEDCPPYDPDNLCAGVQDCREGRCELDPESVVICTPSTESCLRVTCDPTSGLCEPEALPDGTSCDDERACTETDRCQAGACVGGSDRCECEDDGDCALLDEPCEDRHRCNREYFPYFCDVDPGTAVLCDSEEVTACREMACTPATGACELVPLPDGSVCDDGDPCSDGSCVDGACVAGLDLCECREDVDCGDDGDPCNGVLRCDDGVLPYVCVVDVATVPGPCPTDEDTECRKAACDPSSGACVLVDSVDGLPCGPPACERDATCLAGLCAGAPVSCDDGLACTADSCDPALDACVFEAVVGACDDGSACTLDDRCVGTECVGGTSACDDEDPCTVDACQPARPGVTCQHVAGNDGASCADGDPCSINEHCDAGLCVGEAKICDDEDPCTLDACAPETGACVTSGPAPEGTGCDDGNGCTSVDACDATGGCLGSSPKLCDDANSCTADVCLPETGACVHYGASVDGQACGSMPACFEEGVCDAGVCLGRLPIFDCCQQDDDCDDGDWCTTGTCVEGRCEWEPVGCYDGVGLCDHGFCGRFACESPRPLDGRNIIMDRDLRGLVSDVDDDTLEYAMRRLRVEPPGAAAFDGGLGLSQGVDELVLHLGPTRIPRGATTLRVLALAPTTLIEGDFGPNLGVRDGDGNESSLEPRVLFDEPSGGTDLLYDLSGPEDRVLHLRLPLVSPWKIGRLRLSHHGADGCMDLRRGEDVHPAGGYYGAGGAPALCTAPGGGDALMIWVKSENDGRSLIASRVDEALPSKQPESHVIASGIGQELPLRVSCVATPTGWLAAWGVEADDPTLVEPGSAWLRRLGPRGEGVAPSERVGVDSYPVDPDADARRVFSPTLQREDDGEILLAWISEAEGPVPAFVGLQRLDLDGESIGVKETSFLTDSGDPGHRRSPQVASRGERVLVGFTRAGSVYATLLDASLSKFGLVNEQDVYVGTMGDETPASALAVAQVDDGQTRRFLVAFETRSDTYGAEFPIPHVRLAVLEEQGGALVKVREEALLTEGAVFTSVGPIFARDDRGVTRVFTILSPGSAGLPFEYALATLRIGADAEIVSWSVLGMDVTAVIGAQSAWPSALEVLVRKGFGAVMWARHGLDCESPAGESSVGATWMACVAAEAQVCVDADIYLPLPSACMDNPACGVSACD